MGCSRVRHVSNISGGGVIYMILDCLDSAIRQGNMIHSLSGIAGMFFTVTKLCPMVGIIDFVTIFKGGIPIIGCWYVMEGRFVVRCWFVISHRFVMRDWFVVVFRAIKRC